MDRQGRVVIEPAFDEVNAFHEGMAAVRLGTKWGYVDRGGRVAVKPQFDEVDGFSEGLAWVIRKRVEPAVEGDHTIQTFTFIDRTGKTLFSVRSPAALGFHDGLASFSTGFDPQSGEPCNWGFVDKTGKIAITPRFRIAHSFSDGLSLVEEAQARGGFIDKAGRFVFRLPPRSSAADYHEGLVAVCQVPPNGKAGYADKIGRLVIRSAYGCDAGDFHCGLACVQWQGRYGYIDPKGVMRIRPRFAERQDFSEGLARFRGDHGYGYIDKNGRIAIKPGFDAALGFHEGLALVRIGDRAGYIDKTGKMVIRLPLHGLDYGDLDETAEKRWSFSEGLAPYGAMQ